MYQCYETSCRFVSVYRQLSTSPDLIVRSEVQDLNFEKGNFAEFLCKDINKWSNSIALVGDMFCVSEPIASRYAFRLIYLIHEDIYLTRAEIYHTRAEIYITREENSSKKLRLPDTDNNEFVHNVLI